MSSALVKQALEFVDQEEIGRKKRNKRHSGSTRRPGVLDRDHIKPYKQKKQVSTPEDSKSKEQIAEENIKKLLALSQPAAEDTIKQKIIERAVKGKPLLEKVQTKVEHEKSILFPDEEPFSRFEKEYFCS